VPPIEDFLRDIDRGWQACGDQRVSLHVIGSMALMLQTDYQRGTKDSDILETELLTPGARQQLLAIAGPGTKLHAKHRVYIEVVANGFPFLPQVPRWRLLPELNAGLQNFDVQVLDVVDVVVSKLKPFRARDQQDIAAIVDRGLVPHVGLVDRFRAAVDSFSYEARAEDLPGYIDNLHQIERDLFGVAESEIELPSWI
jgi:hypothetical protein